jgi:tetrapyrrole methylase family protein / MazG family protein
LFYSFDDLISVMETLRAPKGCPWDREQTHESLMQYFFEELYEYMDALRKGDSAHMCEELGDLLLQVVFHSQIATENQQFRIKDVIHRLCTKLIYRHPHVFKQTEGALSTDEVLAQWEELKAAEKNSGTDTSVLAGIPASYPALMRAAKLQMRAAKVGFDWPDFKGVIAKLHEEIDEVEEALKEQNQAAYKEELGDLLFTIVNLCRKSGDNPEVLLAAANNKFEERFRYMELKSTKNLKELELEELEQLWNKAKSAKQPNS